jgi:hypothetical protein
MSKIALSTLALLAALSGFAQAQTAAPAAAQSTDPIVQMREAERAANQKFNATRTAARSERNAKIKAAEDAAAKDATAQGKDPNIARRNARAKARADTQAEFDARMKPATAERNAARAAARSAAKKS